MAAGLFSPLKKAGYKKPAPAKKPAPKPADRRGQQHNKSNY